MPQTLRDVGYLGAIEIPFDPESVTGLIAWYDAENIDIASSPKISGIHDRSGNSNELSQGNGAWQPDVIFNNQNGLDIIRFSTGSEFIRKDNWASGKSTQPFWVFIVCKMPSAVSSGTQAWCFSSPTTTNDAAEFFRDDTGDDTNGYGINADTDLIDTTEAINESDFLLYSLKYDSSNSIIRKSKVEIEQGDAGTSDIGGFGLNSDEPSGIFGNMEFAEALVYDADLSDSDRDDIEDYLTDRWAV